MRSLARRIRILAALCLALLAAPLPGRAGPPAVLTDSQHGDWHAIGRVNVGGFDVRGMCTGTLIAPDLVLTAAHCLFYRGGDKQGLARPEDVVFVAGWLRGEAVASSPAAATWLHPGFTVMEDRRARIGYDLGLIRLAEPIDPALITPLPVAPLPAEGRPVALIGYRGDRPHILSGNFRCNVVMGDLRVMGLDCPVVGGNSGGPVLSRIDGVWHLVGVVSSRTNGSGPKQPLQALATRPDEAFVRHVTDTAVGQ